MAAETAVVLGLSPTGLYVARELSSHGIVVRALSDARQCGHFSRHLASRGAIEAENGRQLEWLAEQRGSPGATPVLFPTADRYIELIQDHAENLATRFMFPKCYSSGVSAALLDKGAFAALCREQGVSHPQVWEKPSSALRELAAAVRFPCLLKPRYIHRVKGRMAGRKLFVVRDRAEFLEIASRLPQDPSGWLVQEIVPGPDSDITLFGAYFDRVGRSHQGFTARKLRQYPPGFGSASLVVSADLPETRSISEAFLCGIGFTGIAGAEFKLDRRDGKLKMIEVNPRPTLWFSAAHRAGKSIAYAAFQDLTGRPLPEETPQRNGVVWRYFWKDLYSAVFYRFFAQEFILPPPELAGGLAAGVAGRVGAVHEWSDPGPTFGEALGYLRKFSLRRFRPGR